MSAKTAAEEFAHGEECNTGNKKRISVFLGNSSTSPQRLRGALFLVRMVEQGSGIRVQSSGQSTMSWSKAT
jgi:hypothetical protein